MNKKLCLYEKRLGCFLASWKMKVEMKEFYLYNEKKVKIKDE